ncbi:MAG: hypothetical protein RIB86_21870 [Imperialibacter sp.]
MPTAITKGIPRSPDSYRDRNRDDVGVGRVAVLRQMPGGAFLTVTVWHPSGRPPSNPLSTFTLTNCNFTASQPGMVKPNA